jgi:hypothetical protein
MCMLFPWRRSPVSHFRGTCRGDHQSPIILAATHEDQHSSNQDAHRNDDRSTKRSTRRRRDEASALFEGSSLYDLRRDAPGVQRSVHKKHVFGMFGQLPWPSRPRRLGGPCSNCQSPTLSQRDGGQRWKRVLKQRGNPRYEDRMR